MIRAYRLCNRKYPANDGTGAAVEGGRWNPKGIPLIYSAESVALAQMEILVHYSVLPKGFVLTEIEIPLEPTQVEDIATLPVDWADHYALSQSIGSSWVKDAQSAVLSVPSSVSIPAERNYLINPAHPEFSKIRFSDPTPFEFDPRLK